MRRVKETDHITVHTCVSASGYALPPYIILEKSFPSGPYARSGVDDAVYAVSPNGYMDSELFMLWIQKQFIPQTAHIAKPILLILDGHESHLDVDMIDLLVENNIHLFCLPPHTTNILQPLDVAIFKPLKAKFSNLTDIVKLASLTTSNPLNVSKKNFTALFKVAFEQCLNVGIIKNGFRKCGIVPFNPDAIDKKRLMPTASTSIETPTASISSTTSTAPESNATEPTSSGFNATEPTSSAFDAAKSTASASTDIPSTSACRPPTLPGASTSASPLHSTEKSRNPLVAAGVIPAELVDCFITPETKKSKKEKNTRVITEARVLTSDEHRKLFREKVNRKIAEEEAKERRKEERDRKRLEKERVQEEKRRKKAE